MAIVAGALVLGERITIWTVVGFVIVVLGAYLVTRHRRPVGTAEVAVPVEPRGVAPE